MSSSATVLADLFELVSGTSVSSVINISCFDYAMIASVFCNMDSSMTLRSFSYRHSGLLTSLFFKNETVIQLLLSTECLVFAMSFLLWIQVKFGCTSRSQN